jgi:hypothetical protein
MSDYYPKGGWSIFTHEGVEYRVPTERMNVHDRNLLDTAIDRILNRTTDRDHNAVDGIRIKQEYDCCSCDTYIKIVRDSIEAIRIDQRLYPKDGS